MTEPAEPRLRVVLVEDDARYRASLETLLDNSPGFALAASFGDAERALAWFAAAERFAFDVVIMDVELPGMSGIAATGKLRERFPDAAVAMLTVFEEPKTILAAICAGASGYMLKRTSARELLAQLRSIADGGSPMSAGVARTVLELLRRGHATPASAPGRLDLTEREQQVLRGLVRGLSYKQVADDLAISHDTVRTYIRTLYKKLQVHNVAAAVTRAVREGLV